MKKENKYITVLDFEVGKVFQYESPMKDDVQYEEYETYISGLGHKLSNCQWMAHDSPEIITP